MSASLNFSVFTAPEKALVGERPRPFGPQMTWDPATATLIHGDSDAVLIDTLTTVAEAEALARWVALHQRNLTTLYVTHGHIDHFAGLGVLLDHFPDARAFATAKSVELMAEQLPRLKFFRGLLPGELPTRIVMPAAYHESTFTLEGNELRIIE